MTIEIRVFFFFPFSSPRLEFVSPVHAIWTRSCSAVIVIIQLIDFLLKQIKALMCPPFQSAN